MSEEKDQDLISDNEGLLQMSFILQAMAIDDDAEDMLEVAEIIADIPKDLVLKYWGKAWDIRESLFNKLDEESEDV